MADESAVPAVAERLNGGHVAFTWLGCWKLTGHEEKEPGRPGNLLELLGESYQEMPLFENGW